MFITDTVDAVYHPDEWSPEALMDKLAEVVAELATNSRVRHISNLCSRALIPFFPGWSNIHTSNRRGT
jgi:hypothetical protein